MIKYSHLAGRESCPFLPAAHHVMRPSEAKSIREAGTDEDYYLAALTCAQSLWLEGKPAQSLLQLNHALSIRLPHNSPTLTQWKLPYEAKLWLFKNRLDAGFLGNPVRHYQHLATRVSGPQKELRSWRAWACFHLAGQILPHDEFPRDEFQIEKENLQIPTWDKVTHHISLLGSEEESLLINRLY
ncbi:hypothetical protein OAI07_01490 [Akkermansiaceae bacterium]|nr:hypothetical protein [Akkermansiaceae bacterium]